jgi:hypothetical protein
MEIQDADLLLSVETNFLLTCFERQPTRDGHYEESAPSSDRAQPHPRDANMKLYNKTTTTIVSLYIACTLRIQ